MLIILIILVVFLERNTGSAYRLIYQKDISEHCRRRVVPSIFLGRQVVEANARLMQFSRLELPYSCFISVRTESGSNIVMMVQVASDELDKTCDKNREQLQVFEMGETFGGYWGPLPDSVMKWQSQKPKVYTLKTTYDTKVTETSVPEEVSEEEETIAKTSTESNDKTKGDYVEIEVPLLNVSVNMEPGNVDPKKSDIMDIEEVFDIRNDVTPVPGVAYDTSILPLVQFHILRQTGKRRQGDDVPPKYELDVIEQFTPDMRLTLPQFKPTSASRKLHYKLKYPANKRLNFKKHKTLLESEGYFNRQLLQTITTRMNYVTKYDFPTLSTQATESEFKYTQDSWDAVEDLLKKLNITQDYVSVATKTTLSDIDQIILEKISNMNHSRSVYLSPKDFVNSSYDIKKLFKTSTTSALKLAKITTTLPYTTMTVNKINVNNHVTQKHIINMTSAKIEDLESNQNLYGKQSGITDNSESKTELYQQKRITNQIYSTSISSRSDNSVQNDNVFTSQYVSEKYSSAYDNDTTVFSNSSNQYAEKISLDSKNIENIATGAMVGHESWENVVQAAPEMAVLLNQTVTYNVTRGNASDDVTVELNQTSHKNIQLKRKKREIHSISIENAKPYKLTTVKERQSTTKPLLALADMQEFAQLVELQDDELHGRVALRYLRQYVGPPLFSLCEIGESGGRHVHLFNSSRIVLAIANFTLERMVIILTSARTLLSGETRCPMSQLECQVSGARVCLDSMVACDGVPNCGSYDIYDEDRLMCGELVNLKHNVYLAAFTLLAVLMTGLYAVHYWLKQCVPKVADAFFVYADGAENILYLDPIMRSPNETDDMSKMVYQSHLFDDDNLDTYTAPQDLKENACKRLLYKLCCCCRQKKKVDELEMYDPMNFSRSLSKRVYSFTELEICKMAPTSTDTAVQTGESLEMKNLEKVEKNNAHLSTDKAEGIEIVSQEFPIMIRDCSLSLEEPLPEEHIDELSLLKFLKDVKTDSIIALSKKSKKNVSRDISIGISDEKEIRSHAYEHHDHAQPGPSKGRKTTPKDKIVPSVKHLRFDDVATTIPSADDYNDDDDDADNDNLDHHRSTAFGESRPPWGARNFEAVMESEDHGGAAKEHRNFWGLPQSKTKKSKKKSHISTLRQ